MIHLKSVGYIKEREGSSPDSMAYFINGIIYLNNITEQTPTKKEHETEPYKPIHIVQILRSWYEKNAA